mgnify:FL=1
MEGRLHISQKSSTFVPELAKGHLFALSRKHLYVYYD